MTNQEDTLDQLRGLAVLVYVRFHHLCVVIKHVCLRTTYSHLLSIYRPNFLSPPHFGLEDSNLREEHERVAEKERKENRTRENKRESG